MDLIDKYIDELKNELVIDEMNVGQVQRRLPARRHFWAARLIQHKRDIFSVDKELQEKEKSYSKQIKEESLTRITHGEALAMAKQHPDIIKLKNKKRELELVVELLEKAEKNLNSMVWDIKNIVALMQLETL